PCDIELISGDSNVEQVARAVGVVDWTVLIVYLAAMASGGLWLARRQRSTEDYFVGGRNVPGWAAGLSLFATSISTATFLAYPGHGYGGDWALLVPGLMLPFVAVYTTMIVVPFYRSTVRVSAFEYLERRFGRLARFYAAIQYILFELFRMGFVLFLAAKAIHAMTGWNLVAIILVGGAVTIVYTTIGGVRAVIWTDVFQAITLFAGGLLCAGLLLFTPDGGPGRVFEIAHQADKFHLGEVSLDLTRPTVLVLVLYGLASYAMFSSLLQTGVQRYLSVPTTREAQRGIWIGAMSCVFTWTLFMLVGTLLYAYYQIYPSRLPPVVAEHQTEVFPYFIVTQLPQGLIGIFLAAMCAAGMSSLDSSMNALALTTLQDLAGRFTARLSRQANLRLAMATSVFWGVLGTGVALSMMRVESALEFSYVVISILGGGLLGMFLLAIFVRRAHALGVYIGLAAGILVTLWATLDKLLGLGLPLPEVFRGSFPLHVYLTGPIANAIAFLVGYAASLVLPDVSRRETSGLTYWSMRK
ncbi:MAG: sodium:solute symporter, partial [Pirellulales bacterium]|nr:sodium:solute symporter [Pirellulales bacterium]